MAHSKHSLPRDARGSVYVETLIAFLPVFVFFLATLQLADASVAQLVVDHASAAAARAAVVVLPDDGQFYEDRDQKYLDRFDSDPKQDDTNYRHADVEYAADLILRANPRLNSAQANVALAGEFSGRSDITATVTARYACLLPTLCGGGFTMRGQSSLVYQGAKYEYDDTTIGKFHRDEKHSLGDKADGEPPKKAPAKNDDPKQHDPEQDPPRKPREDDGTKRDSEGRLHLPIATVTDSEGHRVPYQTCFLAGTGVSTPEGTHTIESIAAGDVIYAFDEGSEQRVEGKVVRTFQRTSDRVFDLTVRYLGTDELELISGTGEHPFYQPNTGTYLPLEQLAPNDELLTLSGARAVVVSLLKRAGVYTVYNFEVAGEHNYYVQGSNDPPRGVLVHNAEYNDVPTGRAKYPRPPWLDIKDRKDANLIWQHYDALEAWENRFWNRTALYDAFAPGTLKNERGGHGSKVTEAIGERALTKYMLDKRRDYELLRGFADGPGFDQVWVQLGPDGRPSSYIIGEAKGKGATLAGAGPKKSAQMSKEWVNETIEEMKGNPETRQLALELEQAMATGHPPVRGLLVTADNKGGYKVQNIGKSGQPVKRPTKYN